MIRRVLVAVDDSPASLAAARAAVELAAGWHASLRAVSVVGDHAVAERLAAVVAPAGGESLERRRARAASAVLRHVERLAERSGVPIETLLREGSPAAVILDEARRWAADLLVLGRSDRHAAGEPAIGSQTRQVLEFAEEPVLVVPRGRA
jgi:nucleotide-binding universal stress UspA family protein